MKKRGRQRVEERGKKRGRKRGRTRGRKRGMERRGESGGEREEDKGGGESISQKSQLIFFKFAKTIPFQLLRKKTFWQVVEISFSLTSLL